MAESTTTKSTAKNETSQTTAPKSVLPEADDSVKADAVTTVEADGLGNKITDEPSEGQQAVEDAAKAVEDRKPDDEIKGMDGENAVSNTNPDPSAVRGYREF